MGWDTLNLIATIGAFVIALSVLVFLVNVDLHRRAAARSRRTTRGTRRTLEWSTRRRRPSTTSPRSRSSTHRDEFWHRKYTEDDEGRLVQAAAERRGRRRSPRRRDPARAAQHPHAVAVVLAVGRSRSACRSSATASCSRTGGCCDPRRRADRSSASTPGRLEPATEPRHRADGRSTDGALDEAEHERRRSRSRRTTRARHEHRRQQHQARRSGCSCRRRPVLRRVHLHVLPATAAATRSSEGPDARPTCSTSRSRR